MSSSSISQQDIVALRRFNRAVTLRVGALTDHFLGRDRPLGESRLIYEIGAQNRDVRELRERLDLDSGYLSRLLRSLETQGLVQVVASAGDRRVRVASLTADGLQEFGELDRRADLFAAGILSRLEAPQRRRLVESMATVERLLSCADVEIVVEDPASPGARSCVDKYFAELAERFEGGFDDSLSISAEDEELSPPTGIFFVARLDGRPIGCGALKTIEPGVGSIKRMWVDRAARGLGLGRRLLARLEAHAESAGLHTVRLETHRSLGEAQSLYRKCGYREVEAFNDDPYADYWFEKSVGSSLRS